MPALSVRRGGTTLPELLVAITLGVVIGSAVVLVLVRHERMATGLAARSAGGVQLRHGRDALRGELRAIAEGGTPLLRTADTAIELRSTVGLGLACATPGGSASEVVVAAAGLAARLPADAWVRAIAPGDSVLLRDPTDGRWHGRTLESVGRTRCVLPAGGTEVDARRLTLTRATPPTGSGWIVRIVRSTVWSAYRGSDRAWWLGLRERTEGRWGTVQPVMGPLSSSARPSVFATLDRHGAPLPLVAGGDSAWGIRVALSSSGAARDSLVLLVPLWVAP